MLILAIVQEAGATASWWSPTAAGAYAASAAVLVSLVLGLTSILRENRRVENERELRRKTHDTRVSAHAYAFRREMWEWVTESWPENPGSRVGRAMELVDEEVYGPAEELSRTIVATSSGASSEVAEAARRQYALFHRATLILDRVAIAAPDTSESEYNPVTGRREPAARWPSVVTEGMDEARSLLVECIGELTKAIDDDLLEAEDDAFREEP